ncbi:unnamed protein product [Spirodela intermedia]|uniref:FAM192A/Fyv6 N-terminal domain-containing protein n=1 Tax=Spirodela intermedia TaxID=51605 RepID=A0ABN7EC15_SPIIN|nr:unnamed protein product [Spirodela intermedia]
MADDGDYAAPPIRLMTFVSQEELERSKKARGERVDDGTAQRDRPLYEILKENKEKKDTEFNERFKHSKTPKALDEDEMEFLDRLEKSRKEHERQVADEEEEELQRFRKAVEAQSAIHELKEAPRPPTNDPIVWILQDPKPARRRASRPATWCLIISAKPPAAKRAKPEAAAAPPPPPPPPPLPLPGAGEKPQFSLVSYGDESEED